MREWSGVVSGEFWVGCREGVLHPEGGWILERAPRGSGRGASPDGVWEAFGQCSHVYGVTLGDGALQGQELVSMILLGPFQLSLLCYFVFLRHFNFMVLDEES